MTEAIKLVGVLKRRDDLSLEQFSRHWLEVHGPLALRITRFYQYVQNHRLPIPLAGLEPPADGLPFVWVRSLADGVGIASDPAYMTGAMPDEANFIGGAVGGAVVSERTLIAAPARFAASDRLPKALVTFRRRPDLSPEAFRAAFEAAGRPWFCPADGLLQCVRSTVLPGYYDLAEPAVDAIEELWWADEQGAARAAAAARDDAVTALCAADGIKGMRVLEHRLRW